MTVSCPVVEIEQGKLQGITLATRDGKPYFGYLGVPYAKKPERFQLADPPEKWEGIRDATKFGAKSIQRDSRTKQMQGSEDCLFANVYTPKVPIKNTKDRLPVMVFIHGGGFSLGGGDDFGGKYICDENVLLVTINYRLGALGFLSTGDGLIKGNMGLDDQVKALQWIQRNVEAFGGDKSLVTIFGESAGSGCCHYMCLSPKAKGLFSSVILQSGTSLSPWARNKNPSLNAKRLGKLVNIPTHDMKEYVNELMKLDARAIAAQSLDFENFVPSELPIYFAPCCEIPWEGAFIIETPYDIINSGNIPNQVPMMLGCNTDEGLYRTLPTIKNKKQLEALNKNWTIASQMALIYNKDNVPNSEEFACSARKFYLGENAEFCEETLEGFTNMISDRLFNCSIEATARIHSKVKNDPNNVFLYLFGYKGNYSMLNIFKIDEVIGVSHGDELQYLMNQSVFRSKIEPDSEAEMVSRKMVKLWTSFAENCKPNLKGAQNTWEPLNQNEPLGWYRIEGKNSDCMVTNPFGNRLEFWEKLPWNQFLF